MSAAFKCDCCGVLFLKATGRICYKTSLVGRSYYATHIKITFYAGTTEPDLCPDCFKHIALVSLGVETDESDDQSAKPV